MGQFICKLYKKKETRILMNGLDAAGKTTILYFLKLGEAVTTIPTIGFNVETLTHKNISLTTWDIGGRDKIRPLYRHYYPNTDAIMFVIDSSDRDRLEIVADEIMKMLLEQEIENVPCLILANKQDLKSAMSLDEIKEGLNYDKILSQYIHRKINIFGCSAVTEDGQRDLHKALDWLCDELAPPRSAWWTRTSDKPNDHNNDNNTDSSTKKNTDDSTDTEKVVKDNLKSEKIPWSLGSYLKGTFVSFKSALPSLW